MAAGAKNGSARVSAISESEGLSSLRSSLFSRSSLVGWPWVGLGLVMGFPLGWPWVSNFSQSLLSD